MFWEVIASQYVSTRDGMIPIKKESELNGLGVVRVLKVSLEEEQQEDSDYLDQAIQVYDMFAIKIYANRNAGGCFKPFIDRIRDV